MTDLEEAIQIGRQAVDTTPDDHPDRARHLNNLGVHLSNRYSRTGAIVDLEEAIQVIRQAVDAILEDHPDRAACLNNLGNHLSDRYSRTGAMIDLEEAIQVGRQALDITPDHHPDRARHLNNLGVHLNNRYSRTGAMVDLEEAIQVGRQAVDATPEDHPDRARHLNNLGNHLSNLYSRTGAMTDLEEAIQVGRQAVDTIPDDHPNRARHLNNLGIYLSDRYSRTGAMTDLEEAIQVIRQAVDATPDNHPDRVKCLDNLGNRLGDRYSRTGAMTDLEEAIQIGQQAIDITPDDHPDRAGRLNNLGIYLSDRYSRTGAMTDLEEAIQVGRQAVDTTPDDHPNRATCLNNLGNRLGDRYSRTGAMTDLEEAIQVGRQAVDAKPDNHPDRAMYLNNLGVHLSNRYSRTGAITELEDATSCHHLALHQVTSNIITRIQAGRQVLINSAKTLDWKQAYEASSLAVSLVPKAIPRSLENSDKQHTLSQVAGLASGAAAAALNFQQHPLAALRLLEQGRGLLAASADEIRVDVLDLQEKDPDLADKFIAARQQLQSPTSDQRHKANEEFDKLIAEIREMEGFANFLDAPSREEIQAAAVSGPIAVINVSAYRCDEILVDLHQIQVLALPSLRQEEIKVKISNADLGSPEVLQWLWDVVAEPVINALGYTDSPSCDQWPHIWWIPTGLLTRFPLHAAGYHDRASGQTVIDRVMSSYSPSIKAMIQTRRRTQVPSTAEQAILVAMEETPGQSSLPYATEEVKKIRKLCHDMSLTPVEPSRYKAEVESHLPRCKIFHFAGHGYTHPSDPSMSSLVLEDGEDHPLTVGGLFELNLRKSSPFLAYLSACGTGRVRDERFMDESIHLISGCQLAGFRHVVGTLWNVIDETCVDMARMTYEEMRDSNMTDDSVCRGLHKASRVLRNRWLKMPVQTRIRGGRDRDIQPEGGETGSLDWVPYVHFGV
ncbi:CHAT domain-containing protein [Lipomyces starkeyi]